MRRRHLKALGSDEFPGDGPSRRNNWFTSVARGQIVRITFRIPDDQAQSNQPQGRIYVATSVGVYDAVKGAEIKSFELSNPAPGVYMFDIGGDGRDVLFGGENVNRVQLRVATNFVVGFDRPVVASGNRIGLKWEEAY